MKFTLKRLRAAFLPMIRYSSPAWKTPKQQGKETNDFEGSRGRACSRPLRAGRQRAREPRAASDDETSRVFETREVLPRSLSGRRHAGYRASAGA